MKFEPIGIGWHNWVLEQAGVIPDAPALIGPDEVLSFKQLAWRAGKWAAQLQKDGVKQNDIVVVRMPKAFDFVATLALSMLGATAVSNTAKQYYEFEPETDWLLTRQAVDNYPIAKQLVLTPPWQQRAMNNLEPYLPAGMESGSSLARIALTSGTTGRPKAVAISHDNLMARLEHWVTMSPMLGIEWHLSDLGPIGGILRAIAAMKLGLPAFHLGVNKDPRMLVELSKKYPPVHLTGSPAQLEQFFGHLLRSPLDFSKMRSVRAGGATVPITLQLLVRNTFGFDMDIVYGSTEAGFACARKGDPAAPAQLVGSPIPDATVQIVDDLDQPMTNGIFGRVRYRTGRMATSYWRNPDETAKHFKDGWFYPGDTGCFLEDGQLLLGGREAELINLGGVKIDPNRIDELARTAFETTEVAAFGYLGTDGNQRLGLAIVVATIDKRKSRSFEKTLRNEFALNAEPRYLLLRELPRNALLKVERQKLAALAAGRN